MPVIVQTLNANVDAGSRLHLKVGCKALRQVVSIGDESLLTEMLKIHKIHLKLPEIIQYFAQDPCDPVVLHDSLWILVNLSTAQTDHQEMCDADILASIGLCIRIEMNDHRLLSLCLELISNLLMEEQVKPEIMKLIGTEVIPKIEEIFTLNKLDWASESQQELLLNILNMCGCLQD